MSTNVQTNELTEMLAAQHAAQMDALRKIYAKLNELEHRIEQVEQGSGDGWQRTPEGLPICPKHGEVMSKREKQGDTWHSHKVTAPDGSVTYCRGYASKNSPGWEV